MIYFCREWYRPTLICDINNLWTNICFHLSHQFINLTLLLTMSWSVSSTRLSLLSSFATNIYICNNSLLNFFSCVFLFFFFLYFVFSLNFYCVIFQTLFYVICVCKSVCMWCLLLWMNRCMVYGYSCIRLYIFLIYFLLGIMYVYEANSFIRFSYKWKREVAKWSKKINSEIKWKQKKYKNFITK